MRTMIFRPRCFHQVFKSLLLLGILFITACTPILTYKPPILPIEFTIDIHGNITVTASAPSIVTPIGTFTVGGSVDLNKKPCITLILRDRRKGLDQADQAYCIHENDAEVEIIINGSTKVEIINNSVLIDISDGSVQEVTVREKGMPISVLGSIDSPTPAVVSPEYALCGQAVDNASWESAITQCSQAIDVHPNIPELYNRRGVAYANLNQFEAAIADYNQALQMNPEFALAYHNLGYAYMKAGNYEDAISHFNRAEQFNLQAYREGLFYNRAVAYHKHGDYDFAIQDYTKVIEMNPYDYQYYYDRGSSYAQQRNYDKAIEDYTHVIDIRPTLPVIYYDRALMYSNIGQTEEAISDLRTCLSLTNDELLHNQAITQLTALGAQP